MTVETAKAKEMTADDDCTLPPVLIYEGTKTFWKPRAALELSIIHHFDHDCVEIVAYHSSFEVEAPRLYVSFSNVVHKGHFQEVLHMNVDVEKELSIRRRKFFDLHDVEKKLSHEAIVQYILARINIVPGLPDLLLEVFLQPSFDDVVVYLTNKIDVELLRPTGLIPFPIHRVVHTTFENFSHLLEQFNDDSAKITSDITEAAKHVEVSQHTMEIEQQMDEFHNNNSLLRDVHRMSDAPVMMRVFPAKVPHVRHVNPPVPHFMSHATPNAHKDEHDEHAKHHHAHHKTHHNGNAEWSAHHTRKHSFVHHDTHHAHHTGEHVSEYGQHHENNRPHSAYRNPEREGNQSSSPQLVVAAETSPAAAARQSPSTLPDVFAPISGASMRRPSMDNLLSQSAPQQKSLSRRPSMDALPPARSDSGSGRVTPEFRKTLSDSHMVVETMETEGRLYTMSPSQSKTKYFARSDPVDEPVKAVRAVYVNTKEQDSYITARSRASEAAHIAKRTAHLNGGRVAMPVTEVYDRTESLPAVHHNTMSSNPNSRRGSRDASPVVNRSSPLLSAHKVNGSMVYFDGSGAIAEEGQTILEQKVFEQQHGPRGYYTAEYHSHNPWSSSDNGPHSKHDAETKRDPVPIGGVTSNTVRKHAPLRSLSADSVEMMVASERARRVVGPGAGLQIDTSSPIKQNPHLPPSNSSPSGSGKRSPLISGGSPSHGGVPRALNRGSPSNASSGGTNSNTSPSKSRSSSPSNHFTLTGGYVTGTSPGIVPSSNGMQSQGPSSLGIAGGSGKLSRNPSMRLIDLQGGINGIDLSSTSGDGSASGHQLAMLHKLSPTKRSQNNEYFQSKTLIPRDFSFDEMEDKCHL